MPRKKIAEAPPSEETSFSDELIAAAQCRSRVRAWESAWMAYDIPKAEENFNVSLEEYAKALKKIAPKWPIGKQSDTLKESVTEVELALELYSQTMEMILLAAGVQEVPAIGKPKEGQPS